MCVCFIRMCVPLSDVVFSRCLWGLVSLGCCSALTCPVLSSVDHIPSIKVGCGCLYYLPKAYFSFPFLSAFPKSKGAPSDACMLIVAIAFFHHLLGSVCLFLLQPGLEWLPRCWCSHRSSLLRAVLRSLPPLPFQCPCPIDSGVCLLQTVSN